MTVPGYVYNELVTTVGAEGGANVYFEFIPEGVNLFENLITILVQCEEIEGETSKTGETQSIETFKIELIATKQSYLDCLNMSRDIRNILTDIKDTNDIKEVEFKRQYFSMQKTGEKIMELSRIIMEFDVYLEPYAI